MLSHSVLLLYFNTNSNIIFITFLLVSVPSSHLVRMLDNYSHFMFWYPFIVILKYIKKQKTKQKQITFNYLCVNHTGENSITQLTDCLRQDSL